MPEPTRQYLLEKWNSFRVTIPEELQNSSTSNLMKLSFYSGVIALWTIMLDSSEPDNEEASLTLMQGLENEIKKYLNDMADTIVDDIFKGMMKKWYT